MRISVAVTLAQQTHSTPRLSPISQSPKKSGEPILQQMSCNNSDFLKSTNLFDHHSCARLCGRERVELKSRSDEDCKASRWNRETQRKN
jgi:hypothetical protein